MDWDKLRIFHAVAEKGSLTHAGDVLHLSQSAVSRQIQTLEEDVGASLFLRHTRAVELTSAGAQLLLAVSRALPQIDGAVRQIRQSAGRKSVSITTFASFASMWLIPRMEAFQRSNADIDIRIDASDNAVDMDVADVDLAIRYGPAAAMPGTANSMSTAPYPASGGNPIRNGMAATIPRAISNQNFVRSM